MMQIADYNFVLKLVLIFIGVLWKTKILSLSGTREGDMGAQKVNRKLHPLLAPTTNAYAVVTSLRKE